MHRRLFILSAFLILAPTFRAAAQVGDTVIVQTLTLDSIGRAGYFHFPDTGTFEKVLMEYTMRCHHALVSNNTKTEQGCGQWDYNCETYIWDSTRTDSLQNLTPSVTISNYPSNTNFPYTKIGTHSITRRDEKLVAYPAGTQLKGLPSITGAGDGALQPYQRFVFVVPNNEQTLSGIARGSLIAGLALVCDVPDTLKDLRIRLHTATPGTYNPVSVKGIYSDTNFIEVYHASTILKPGNDTLLFYAPFLRKDTSDIVVELSYSGASKNPYLIRSLYSASTTGTTIENALSFQGSEFVPISQSTVQKLSTAISIAFWAFGDTSYLPGSNSVFCEGLDNQSHREINIHLPWSDGNVYWDCGGDASGNYDRLQQALPKRFAAGRWNHWVFTKDATSGKMAIYLNGALWASDTGNHRLINATTMLLGGAMSSGIGWFGDVREFAMFNYALDSSAVFQIMTEDANITSFNPIAYFPLNEGSGASLTNSASGASPASVIGAPIWHVVKGEDLPNNFTTAVNRPAIDFLQLMDTSAKRTITDRYTYDTIADHAHIVIPLRIGHDYQLLQNDSLVGIDTIIGDYLATKSYMFDETGKKIDSVNISAQDTVKPSTLNYWARGPQKFELMSFVTPYGIGLDLGKAGKTWEFDVTDYVPVMKGWKRLTMERGSGQEEFDLKFLFIKGTPARNVLDMDQLWPMIEESYQNIQSDLYYQPLKVYLDPAAKGFKIRSYITGHGQQGEFIPQNHYISVNGKKYERLVYKICSFDPLYPQGGTWTYDRSGWCPGMATDLAEYEITGTVTPGDSATLDYGVEPGPTGDSRYDPGTQLMSYGAPNFKLNASIETIQRPSPNIAYARINPACDLPIVFIKNNGSDTLKSLQFDYYVDNGPHLTYTWTGTLPFLDTASVTLPIDSLSFWTDVDTGNFHVDISNPNGGVDEYDHDNHYTTQFTKPPVYNGIVVVNLYTNKDPGDNYYEVLDMSGDTVFQNSGFDASTAYFDSLILPAGCYTLRFHDDGEDGLNYWANPNQGAGYLRFRQTSKSGKVLYTFNPDFGQGVQYDFSIAQSPLNVGITQPEVRHIGLYPNPATNELHYDLEGMPAGMVTIEISNVTGKIVHREQRFTDGNGSLSASVDLSGYASGTYYLHAVTSGGESNASFEVK